MGTEPLNYWFDSQLRRYASQFCRIFQNFTYQTGRKINGEIEYRPIPVKYALNNRQVASILHQNSENIMLSVPVIACYISDIQVARENTQAPFHIDRTQITEREYDADTGQYKKDDGNRYQLDRLMPVPLSLTLKADVWVSNNLQKDQIFEQLIVLFNPSLDLQHSQNAADWGALTIVELIDIMWSSRQYPIGSSDEIEMMTLTFKTNIWIQPPSWLHPQKLINQIVMNIGESDTLTKKGLGEGWDIDWSMSDLLSRHIVTPGNYQLRVDNDELTLLGSDGSVVDNNGQPHSWKSLIELYGKFRENISQIRLKTTNNLDDDSTDIIGTFSYHPTDESKLIWYLDGLSLPSNTQPHITGIIDPHVTFPGKGLPIPEATHRYIVMGDIGESQAWGDLVAHTNDIIQYNATINKWQVVFDSGNQADTEFVQNLKTNKQLCWDGSEWRINVEGVYNPGYWRLFL